MLCNCFIAHEPSYHLPSSLLYVLRYVHAVDFFFAITELHWRAVVVLTFIHPATGTIECTYLYLARRERMTYDFNNYMLLLMDSVIMFKMLHCDNRRDEQYWLLYHNFLFLYFEIVLETGHKELSCTHFSLMYGVFHSFRYVISKYI